MPQAFITGISGTKLSENERAFFREASPWGFILFKRNISDPEQVADLAKSFRDVVGWNAPVLVDQEGGRVQRLGPPNWPLYPPAASFGQLYDRDPAAALAALRVCSRLLSHDLASVAIDVACMPVGDLPVDGADAVIGDRAYGTAPDKVAALAGAAARGILNGGVLPVLKHIPGHGRATADSHLSLPVVATDRETLDRTDFAPFRALAKLPLAMSAHVVFSAIDAAHPATTSATMVREVIRGSIGFQGLLMSDDISMGALSGTIAERSRAAIAAGCDIVLHCNGKLDEMQEVVANVPQLSGASEQRAKTALAMRQPPSEFDSVAGRRVFEQMMAPVWQPELVSA
jgi:beta-N-acetylhexosaminidase